MTQKKLILNLLEHYNKAILSLPRDKFEAFEYLRRLRVSSGVCAALKLLFDQEDTKYWIARHVDPKLIVWWCHQPLDLVGPKWTIDDISEVLLYRAYILKKEYDWHRWAPILCKVFGPPGVQPFSEWRKRKTKLGPSNN